MYHNVILSRRLLQYNITKVFTQTVTMHKKRVDLFPNVRKDRTIVSQLGVKGLSIHFKMLFRTINQS